MKYLLPIVCLINSICYGQFYFNITADVADKAEVYGPIIYDLSDSSFVIHGNAVGDHRPFLLKINNSGDSIDSVLIENNNAGYTYNAGYKSIEKHVTSNIVNGFIQHSGGSSIAYAVKLDEFGDTLWTYQSDSLGNADGFSAVRITQDTNYVFTGPKESSSNGAQDFWLVKLDTNGNMLWQKNYGGGDTDYALNVDTTIDGGFIVAGYTQSYGAGNSDIYIVKTDVDGNFQWHKWFGQSSYDSGFVKSLQDGHFIIYGAYSYENPATPGEIATHAIVMELDENGDQVWFNEYSEYNLQDSYYYTHDEGFNSMAILSDGYLFSGGTDDSLDGTRLGWAVKTDFNGNQLWSRTYRKRSSANYFQDVTSIPGGDLVFSGFVWPENGSQTSDGWLVRTNCLGFDGPPLAAGTWHNAALNEVILENDSERFGDGIIYWGDGDSTLFTEFDDTLIGHVYASAGNYDISLIVNACSESDTVVINADASVTGLANPQDLKFAIFPNPAKDEVRIRYDINDLSELSYLKMYDLSGKLIYQEVITDQHNELVLRLDEYDKGVYLVNIITENGDNLTKKLVVH